MHHAYNGGECVLPSLHFLVWSGTQPGRRRGLYSILYILYCLLSFFCICFARSVTKKWNDIGCKLNRTNYRLLLWIAERRFLDTRWCGKFRTITLHKYNLIGVVGCIFSLFPLFLNRIHFIESQPAAWRSLPHRSQWGCYLLVGMKLKLSGYHYREVHHIVSHNVLIFTSSRTT